MRTVLRYQDNLFFELYFNYDIFNKWINKIKRFNLDLSYLPEYLFKKFRHYFCPKRLYKYGNVGLFVFDDRTWIEKVCDRVENYIEYRKDIRRFSKANSIKQVWHTFFDYGMSKFVDSSKVIKEHEKEGYIYTTHAESERYAKIYKDKLKKEHREKIKKDIHKKFEEIQKGRSFVREIQEQAKIDDKIRREREREYARNS